MRIDPKATAVNLSRAAKQWQAVGEAKIAAGRNAGDRDGLRRLSSLLDAVGALAKSRSLWIETAKLLREAGGEGDRSAAVADKQAATCGSQIGFCSESFHELVLQRISDQEHPPSISESRVAAWEFERVADARSLDWLIARFNEDPALRNPASWGDNVDLWWLAR